MLPIVAIGVLSGSRTSFILIVFAYWGYYSFYLDKEINIYKHKILIVLSCAVVFLSFIIGANGDIELGLISLVYRVVASGDIYWMSLPNDIWKDVLIVDPFIYQLKGLLGPLRLISIDGFSNPIGYQVNSLVNPTLIDPKTGPVGVFSVVGLISFGMIGGIIFSLVQAILAAYACRFSYIKSKSLIVSSIFFTIFFSSIMLFLDLSYGLGALLNALFGVLYLSVIIIISKIINFELNIIK